MGASVLLKGNTFLTYPLGAKVTKNGLENWINSKTIVSIRFKTAQAEVFQLQLRLQVPEGKSKIKVSVNGQEYIVEAEAGTLFYYLKVGKFWENSSRYVRVDLQGIKRSGSYYANISELRLLGLSGDVYHVQQDVDHGQQGPSVHLTYSVPTVKPIVNYYTTATVPFGQDVFGAYYVAIGFDGGYLGIQVNSSDGEKRRVLFSIWSDYDTHDPAQTPPDYQITPLDRGCGVVVKTFGGEGTGMQSWLNYKWKVGEEYGFLVHGCPIGGKRTKITGWFFAEGKWNLIASFMRPNRASHLTGWYAFSENFQPEMGNIERRVLFGNQWARDMDGGWHEVVKSTFTANATGESGDRKDYAGGVYNKQFYLRNCGYFDDNVPLYSEFSRPATTRPPVIPFKILTGLEKYVGGGRRRVP
jgi:hypothetical protein